MNKRYPGITPYTADDVDVFFGRETEARSLSLLIDLNPVVLVHGGSGVGKTSLVNTIIRTKHSILNTFRIRFPPHMTIRLHDMIAEAIHLQAGPTPGPDWFESIVRDTEKSNDLIWLLLKRIEFALGEHQEFHFIFDQFEEISNREQHEVEKLKAVLAPVLSPYTAYRYLEGGGQQNVPTNADINFITAPLNVRMIFVTRSDALQTAAWFSDTMPGILRAQLELRPMTKDAAALAVSRPAEVINDRYRYPFRISNEAVEMVLNTIESQSGRVDLPLLQLFCSLIEDMAKKKSIHIISASHIQGIRHLWRDYYEESLLKLSGGKRTIRRMIENEFLINGKKTLAGQSMLLAKYKGSLQMLDDLVNRRIITKSFYAGNIYYELAHDALAEIVELDATKSRRRTNYIQTVTIVLLLTYFLLTMTVIVILSMSNGS